MRLKKAWLRLVGIGYDLFLKLNPRKIGAHAVILNEEGRVLLLRSRYADHWSLPGGGLDRHENLDAAVIRECREELGVAVALDRMTGLYYHRHHAVYVGIFRCRIVSGEITLSHEHSDLEWRRPEEVPGALRQMVADALDEDHQVALRTFA